MVALLYVASTGWSASQIAPTHGVVRWAIRITLGVGAAAAAWIAMRGTHPRRVFGIALIALSVTTMTRSRTYASAEALWRDTVHKAPDNARAYDNLAFNLFFDTPPKLAEAKELYWRAIALDSTYLHAWPGLASIAVDEGHPAEAVWLLQRALAIKPDYADAVDHLGRLLVQQGQSASAIPYLARFASAYPSDSAFARLGAAYMSAGRVDSAALAFRNALALNPMRADAATYLGGLLVEQERGGEAAPLLERVAGNGGATGVVVGLLSLAYAEVGRTDEAAQAAQGAIERAGNDPSVYLLAGRAMLRAARAEEAAQILAQAVKLAPSSPEAITQLGLAVAALGKHDDAVALFRRALSIDAGYAPAIKALAAAR
jgi:tetratricopeptide (TPR) repeat protein